MGEAEGGGRSHRSLGKSHRFWWRVFQCGWNHFSPDRPYSSQVLCLGFHCAEQRPRHQGIGGRSPECPGTPFS